MVLAGACGDRCKQMTGQRADGAERDLIAWVSKEALDAQVNISRADKQASSSKSCLLLS